MYIIKLHFKHILSKVDIEVFYSMLIYVAIVMLFMIINDVFDDVILIILLKLI